MKNIECPYCLSPINQNSETIICDSCGALYHHECWVDNGGCCVANCPQVKKQLEIDIQPEQGDLLVLTKEAIESAIQHKPERTWNPCLRCGRHVAEGDLYCKYCRPEPEGNQDAKNLGPLLLALVLVAIVIFWFIYVSIESSETQDSSVTTKQGETAR